VVVEKVIWCSAAKLVFCPRALIRLIELVEKSLHLGFKVQQRPPFISFVLTGVAGPDRVDVNWMGVVSCDSLKVTDCKGWAASG
jgi:hypothetical protein